MDVLELMLKMDVVQVEVLKIERWKMEVVVQPKDFTKWSSKGVLVGS